MYLSVIITNYKAPEMLRLCLQSVKKAAANLDSEMIIVDSESDEETQDLMREEFPEAKLFYFEQNVGYAKLVNRGLKEAGGKYIMILNHDMVLLPDALKKMTDYMEKNPAVGVLGPQLLNFNGSAQESCFRFYTPATVIYRRTLLGKTKKGAREQARFLMKDFDRQSPREVDWMLGTALMLRREAIEKVGPMDERFFMYFEDVDWCRRFWAAAWKVVYFPEAKMYHYHGRGSKKTGGIMDLFFNKYTWIHLASAAKYFWKYRKQC